MTISAKVIMHKAITPPAALAAGPTVDQVQVGSSNF